MFIVWFPPAVWPRTTRAVSTRSRSSSCRWMCSKKCSGASSWTVSERYMPRANSAFTEPSQCSRILKPSLPGSVPCSAPHGWFMANDHSAVRNTRYIISASTPIAWRFPTIDSLAFADGMVTFRWRDSAHHNKKRLMTLPVNEFSRRLLLHVLPPGFVRIRYFGWMAHRRRGASLPVCLQLLAQSGRFLEAEPAEKGTCAPRPLWTCPQCGGPMVLLKRFSSMELRWRSPPLPASLQP